METECKSNLCLSFGVSEDMSENMYIKEDVDKCKGRYCNGSGVLYKENVHEDKVIRTVDWQHKQCDLSVELPLSVRNVWKDIN